MRISDWSSDVCSSDLIHRQSSLERFSSKLRLRSYSSLSQAWTIPEIFHQSSQLGYLAYIRVGIFPFEWMEIFSVFFYFQFLQNRTAPERQQEMPRPSLPIQVELPWKETLYPLLDLAFYL